MTNQWRLPDEFSSLTNIKKKTNWPIIIKFFILRPQGTGQSFLSRPQGAGQGFLFRPQDAGHISYF